MVDTGIVDVGASPTLPHDRDAVYVESHVVGISNRAVASLSLRRVAAKLHAQLGQDAVDVPTARTSPIGGVRTRATAYLAGEPGCIHRSSHAGRGGRRGRYKALVEEEESVKALLLAKQKLTQQAKEARDAKAKDLEEVEAEARTARESGAQSARNYSTRSPSPVSRAQWAAGLHAALDGEVKESFNQWLGKMLDKLSIALQILRKVCEENALTLKMSAGKTEAIVLMQGKQAKEVKRRMFAEGGDATIVVGSYRHLGCRVDCTRPKR